MPIVVLQNTAYNCCMCLRCALHISLAQIGSRFPSYLSLASRRRSEIIQESAHAFSLFWARSKSTAFTSLCPLLFSQRPRSQRSTFFFVKKESDGRGLKWVARVCPGDRCFWLANVKGQRLKCDVPTLC